MILNAKEAICSYCRKDTSSNARARCANCRLTACPLCAKFYTGITVRPELPVPKPVKARDELFTELAGYIQDLIKENEGLRERIKELEEDCLSNDLERSRLELEGIEDEEEVNVMKEDLKIQLQEDEIGASAPMAGRKIINRLYNLKIEFEIEGVPNFVLTAIVDTGATSCCANIEAIPQKALDPLDYTVNFWGVNSQNIAKTKVKAGKMKIGENNFRIPFIYAFPMEQKDGIQMLLGCNFLRSMAGGVRLEGTSVTFYKNIVTVQTSMEAEIASKAIEELELDAGMYDQIREMVYYQTPEVNHQFERRFSTLLNKLKEKGYIGENPMKYWAKNKIKCKLEIINPDITIQDKPLKHVTPGMEAQFKKHIDSLIQLGVIRPSKSRHRTMAMIVQSGTSIDPETGKEVRGKERMVFNYRSLNDNTHKDQYSLPGINTILKKVGNSKVYSKFDLKSGFHQVAMDEESIPWTAFVVPGGLYEWLVMPFGLKNAPAVFQRKMDACFQGTEEFLAVYIDDVLIFSKNEEDHKNHLERFLKIVEREGLVLSPTKMKIAVKEIEFLGATIGNSRIKLQPHIIRKIADFPEDKLKEKKGLRSWLGVLNYARTYIPNLSTLLGPLYQKTSPHGDKRLKPHDYDLIRKIKDLVQRLPDLKIPPKESYIILETDGCMEGWGGVCKWKPNKYSSKKEEQIAAYASGKFSTVKSTIDAEIHAAMETLTALKIHYLDKREVTLRTDCQAIVSFYNKSAQNKPSRVRWLAFTDYISGLGIKVNFEHIDGSDNTLADSLSRLTYKITYEEAAQMILGETAEPEASISEQDYFGLTPLVEIHRKALDNALGKQAKWEEKRKWAYQAQEIRKIQAQKCLKHLSMLREMAQEELSYCLSKSAKDNYWETWLTTHRRNIGVLTEANRVITSMRYDMTL